MADAITTLNGLITINDKNLADIKATNVLDDAPLVQRLFALPASNGTQHKYERKDVSGTSGFRAIGAGLANTAAQVTLVTETLKYLDATIYADVAVAKGYKGGVDGYMARQLNEQLRSAFYSLEQQIINGTSTDASGFTGFGEYVDELTDTMIVDAGGTTASTATSVYLLRTGEDGVGVVAGNDGVLEMSEEPALTRVLDGSSDPYAAYMMELGGYFCVQYAGTYNVARIANITEDSGKGLTDDLIAQAIAKFPAARRPNLIVMNRRSQRQLQDSRTATNPTGAPAPFPESAFGIEIVVTDAIASTESVVTTTTTTTTTT